MKSFRHTWEFIGRMVAFYLSQLCNKQVFFINKHTSAHDMVKQQRTEVKARNNYWNEKKKKRRVAFFLISNSSITILFFNKKLIVNSINYTSL